MKKLSAEIKHQKIEVAKTILVWVFIFGAIVILSIFGANNSDESFDDTEYHQEDYIVSRDEAIYEHWDEIKGYLNGTETIDACSRQSGNCYDLDADISSGQVETIYFPNGGYLYFSANIYADGEASDFDKDGNEWVFTIDMESSMVDDAIYSWQEDNNYEVEEFDLSNYEY